MNSSPANGRVMIRFKSNAEIPRCLSVAAPVFDEGATTTQPLEQALAQQPVQEMVVADDASRDDTWAGLQSHAARDQRVKLCRRGVLEKRSVEKNRFGYEPEITAKVSRLNARVYEAPISGHGCTYAEGRKIGGRDGVGALRGIIEYFLT
jgi:hypothetical protein